MSKPVKPFDYDSTQPLPGLGVAVAIADQGIGTLRLHDDGRYSIVLESDLAANAVVNLQFAAPQSEQERFMAQLLETPSGLALFHVGVARFSGRTGYLCAYGDVAQGCQLVF